MKAGVLGLGGAAAAAVVEGFKVTFWEVQLWF